MAPSSSISQIITLLKAVTVTLITLTPIFYLAYTNRLPDRVPPGLPVLILVPISFIGVFYLDGYLTLAAAGLSILGVILVILIGAVIHTGIQRIYQAFATVAGQVWRFVARSFF